MLTEIISDYCKSSKVGRPLLGSIKTELGKSTWKRKIWTCESRIVEEKIQIEYEKIIEVKLHTQWKENIRKEDTTAAWNKHEKNNTIGLYGVLLNTKKTE